ncbi:MAG: hypothetical protein JST65_20815 [Acidobacteria bacterium]|nr:hypothetical protein [Acidobacteriota bacterium]
MPDATTPKDWKKIAQASGYDIPEAQLEAISPALNTLHNAFAKLPAMLTAEDDPAPLFSPFAEDGR